MNIDAWITRKASDRPRRAPSRAFAAASPPAEFPTIAVDPMRTYQTIDGFGFSLTGGSAGLIARLSANVRHALLRELFGRHGDGLGVNCLRLTIGASDLSDRSFSYDDVAPGEADPSLARFDLLAGDAHVVPVLRKILAINPELKIIASPWSAPPWMKTNGSFIAGRLARHHYGSFAKYFVAYLEAMRRHGIRVSAITPQNEPDNDENEPSMLMSAAEQAEFIGEHLGPAFRRAGLGTEIWCWDHNCDRPEYPLAVLGDARARDHVSGVAWHLYRGTPEAISLVQRAYPDTGMYLTEQWVSQDGRFDDDLRWHMKNVVIGSTRNWCKVVLEWNLASDPEGDPHTPGGAPNCLGGITIGQTISRNVGYYLMAHTARFIGAQSVRIASGEPEGLRNAAFLTPEDRIVMVALNDNPEAKRFSIAYRDASATFELDPWAIATFAWDATDGIA